MRRTATRSRTGLPGPVDVDLELRGSASVRRPDFDGKPAHGDCFAHAPGERLLRTSLRVLHQQLNRFGGVVDHPNFNPHAHAELGLAGPWAGVAVRGVHRQVPDENARARLWLRLRTGRWHVSRPGERRIRRGHRRGSLRTRRRRVRAPGQSQCQSQCPHHEDKHQAHPLLRPIK